MLLVLFVLAQLALDQPPAAAAATKDDLQVQYDLCRGHLTPRGSYQQGWEICYDIQHALEIGVGIRLPSGELKK